MRRRLLEVLLVLAAVAVGAAWFGRPPATAPRAEPSAAARPSPSPLPSRFDEDLWLETWQSAEQERLAGRLPEAEARFRDALALAELGGPDHFRVDDSLRFLSGFYSNQGHPELGQALLTEYHQLRLDRFGGDHPSTAEVLAILGSNHLLRGQRREAQHCFEEALRIRRQALGAEHLKVADSLLLLSEFYLATDRPDESARLFEQAMAIQAKRIDDREFRASVYEHRAEILEARGQDSARVRAEVRRLRLPVGP